MKTMERAKGRVAEGATRQVSPAAGNRIDATFAALRGAGRGAFMPYLSAGDPSLAVTGRILRGAAAAGADLVEIGFPFSDPIADGPVVQASFHRALTRGARVDDIFQMIQSARAGEPALPVLAMASVTLFEARGGKRFARDAQAAGVDGIILPDLPGDRADAARGEIEAAGLHLINFIAPNTPAARRAVLYRTARGFLYYMSITGLTGAQQSLPADLARQLRDVKKHTAVPVAVGFGISTPEQVRMVQSEADGAIVGSALVAEINRLAEARKSAAAVADGALAFIRKLAGRKGRG
ncbi:MAG: tryptophan synthase subunit alpha [Planctomycetota bacterium]